VLPIYLQVSLGGSNSPADHITLGCPGWRILATKWQCEVMESSKGTAVRDFCNICFDKIPDFRAFLKVVDAVAMSIYHSNITTYIKVSGVFPPVRAICNGEVGFLL
jgi:hypothetical protein